jgi:hypothetical protein
MSLTLPNRQRLDTDQAAEYLGEPFTGQQLELYRMKGIGPVYLKIGKYVRYEPADLDAYLATLKRTRTNGSQRKAVRVVPMGEKPAAPVTVRRGRGRPRNPPVVPEVAAPKRPRGRPRKHPLPVTAEVTPAA